jgi:lipopolysaccharide biosynthesis glycosyltransferase
MRDFITRMNPRITVYTNDVSLMDDKFIQSVVQQIIIIRDADIAPMLAIPKENISKRLLNKPINSGVMFVGRKLVREKAAASLIQIAIDLKVNLEQQATQEYASRFSDLRFKSFPIWWNFTYMPMHAIGPKVYRDIAHHIKILHFNRVKPWSPQARTDDWVLDIWRSIHNESHDWVKSIER